MFTRRNVSLTVLLLAIRVAGAADPAGREVVYSQSGQFVVAGRTLAPAAAPVLRYDERVQKFVAGGWTRGEAPAGGGGIAATNGPTLLLDPNLLVASAERLRIAFNNVLGLSGQYRGRIYVHLLENGGVDDTFNFEAIFDRPKQLWNCRITIPAEVRPERLFDILVRALVFEASHRAAGPGGCEVPRWLTEGLLAHLEARIGVGAVFDRNQPVNTSYLPIEEGKRLSEAIGPAGCLTLEQLSWPGLLEPKPGIEQAFRLSAHALVVELVAMRDGGRSLGQTLLLLPRYENWQFAFLQGFQPHFPSLLDAEKWWAINSLHLGGRIAFENWSMAESLQRLDAALVLPVERRASPDGERERESIDLPTIITTVNFERQKPMLARVISGLFTLEVRAAPHLVRLVADYRATLEKYVADREDARRVERERQRPSRRHEVIVEATLRQLQALATLRQDIEELLPGEPATDLAPGELTARLP